MKLSDQATAARQWWNALQPDPARGRPGNRGAAARLRRCTSLLQAATEPAALDLARRLGVRDGRDLQHLQAALLTACVLAHVRADNPKLPVARQLGAPVPGEAARMSPLRLARLLAAETFEERLVAFRRAVALAGDELNVRDLALALLDWSDACRIRWVFAYHDTPAPAAAEAVAATETADLSTSQT